MSTEGMWLGLPPAEYEQDAAERFGEDRWLDAAGAVFIVLAAALLLAVLGVQLARLLL